MLYLIKIICYIIKEDVKMKSLNYLSKNDYYEIKLGSMLASYDRDLLTMLYQPIIGYGSLALYFTLWSNVKRSEYSSMNKHEVIFNQMDIDSNEFIKCRTRLEALGLLKTYKKNEKSFTTFIYELYAPKSPEEFFDDPLYKGILCKHLGEKEVEKLAIIFKSREVNKDNCEDISSSFSDIYSIDEDDTLKVINIRTNRGRKTINIKNNFEVGEFLKHIKDEYGIINEALTPDYIHEITRLATLLGLDVLSMCEVVEQCYNPNQENHLNYDDLYHASLKYKDGINIVSKNNGIKEYNDDDAFGAFINQMSTTSAFEYLKIKQNYINPSASDVKIINELSSKYGFNSGVINALVQYTLSMCDDKLPANYIYKLADTLARKNVNTTLAAWNALTKKNHKKTSKQIVKDDSINDDVKDNIKSSDGQSLEELMKELE